MAFLLVVSSTSDLQAREYDDNPAVKATTVPLFSGTAPGNGEFIQLDFTADVPNNPVDGSEVCFDFTATNLTADSLAGVQIKGSAVSFGNAVIDEALFTLLPNGAEIDAFANTNTGSGTFVFTGSGCTTITGPEAFQGFLVRPINVMGTNPVTGQMYTTCADAMACFGVSLTCTDYNISLDAECETLLTPELLAINSVVPDSLIRVRIQNEDGSFRPVAMVDDNDVGEAVRVVVDIPGCPDVAPCWSFANIEYKLGPSQICRNDLIVSCAQNIAMSDPIITFACGDVEFIRGQVIREDLCIDDTLFRETVTFAVRDQFGNVSEECTQVKIVLRPNLTRDSIQFPPDTTVTCEAALFSADGTIDPRIVGVPTWDGVELFGNTDITQLCNVFADFEDIQDLDNICNRTIIRRWVVTEWICDGGITEIEHFQTFRLEDTTAPVIDLPVTRIELSASQHGCQGVLDIPDAEVTDNCNQDDIEVEIRYPGGSSFLGDGTNVVVPLGLNNIVEYIARDICGNERRDTIFVDVTDEITPVAVCLRETVISIPGDKVWMDLERFDEDSYDDCELASRCVVRMDHQELFLSLGPNSIGDLLFSEFDEALAAADADFETCYRDYSVGLTRTNSKDELLINIDDLCTDAIQFCCFDAGREVPVFLRVEDAAGNRNECMIMVAGQDKDAPTIECPTEEIYVSCDFMFDAEGDLDGLFGTIREGSTAIPLEIPQEFLVDSSGPLVNGTFVDNCSIGRITQTRVVDIDSICRTGTVTRTFFLEEGDVSRAICTQVITIVGDEVNNPLIIDPSFQTLIEIEVESPEDFENLEREFRPQIMNQGCSLIGLGFTDFVTDPDPNSRYCTKIIRTWQIIDWCRSPNGEVVRDTSQTILVIDNEAPDVTVNASATVPQPTGTDVIELTANATDNVVENPRFLDWIVVVTREPTDVEVFRDTLDNDDFRNSTAVANLGQLPQGNYDVMWVVGDPCGNRDTTLQDLTVSEPNASNSQVSVQGEVASAFGAMMDNIDVYLTTAVEQYDDAEHTFTDLEGIYAFANMPIGGSYYIDPEKIDDALNGVSTLDLILIQKHVLGLKDIEDPYLLLAADVNNDNRITALDLVDMRRLILGLTDVFPSKDSWMFVHDEQDIVDAATFGVPLDETYFIADLQQNMDVRFIGIKTGDISGDAVAHSTQLASGRSLATTSWSYEARPASDGYTYIDIRTTESAEIEGYQATWSWKDASYVGIQPGRLAITDDQVNDEKANVSLLPMSFNTTSTVRVNEGDVLFTLVFESGVDITLDIDNTVMRGEVYEGDRIAKLDIIPVESALVTNQITLAQNTPNPWSEITEIKADLPVGGEVTLRVFDISQKVVYQQSQWVERGTAVFRVGQDEVAQSGLYFYEIEIGGYVARQKMIKVN